MTFLLDLLRRCEGAGFYVADGRLKAPRSVDAALLAEARKRRDLVAEGLRVFAAADALSDECGADAGVRQWTRLMMLASLLEGGEEAALLADADAIAALPPGAMTPMVGAALRRGATVEGWEAKP